MSQIFADNLNLLLCFLRDKWGVAGKMERAGKKEREQGGEKTRYKHEPYEQRN